MRKGLLGIIMGKGDLPALLIDSCKRRKHPYILLPVESQADRCFVKQHPHVWISFGQIKKNISLFKQHNIKQLVFVGNVERPSFFALKLDWKGLKWLASIGWKAFGDDGLLSGIVRLLEKEGFEIVGVHQLIQGLLMPQGSLGKINPSTEDKKNIVLGFAAAKELGCQDIGQGVIVQNGVILATETIKGTDWMITESASLLKNSGAGILVKVSKPKQEKRVDLPTIGPETIKKLAHYGYKGVALEAKAGLILHPEKTINLANQKRIFIYGVSGKEV